MSENPLTTPEKPSNYFTELNAVNVSDKTEKKNGLTYLSWAWAWGELKKRHPFAEYRVHKPANSDRIYFDDGKYAWVEVSVSIPVREAPNGWAEHTEILPVMDNRNQSIPLERLNMMDVNKAIQRALTKAIARHGLGLYIYAGEDLPESNLDDDTVRQMVGAATTREQLGNLYRSLVKEGFNKQKLTAWCKARQAVLSQPAKTEQEPKKD